MPQPLDRVAFLCADETRLKVAEWCSREALTRDEIAARLSRPRGAVSAPDTLLGKKALKPAGQGPRGGEQLKLSPGWAKALAEALAQQQQPAKLEPGADLLLIPLAATESACAVLASGLDEVAWGMPLSGEQLGLLLSPRQDEGGGATIRAVGALEAAGVHPVRVRMSDVLPAAALQAWAASVAGTRAPRLAPGPD